MGTDTTKKRKSSVICVTIADEDLSSTRDLKK